MLEAGLIDYWKNKEFSPAVKQCNSSPMMRISNGPRSLTIRDLQSPFLIWGFGVVLSLMAFCFEKLFYHREEVLVCIDH